MEADILAMILNFPTNEQFYQFLHYAVDELVGKSNSGLGHINNDVDWSEEDQALARKYFQNIFKNASLDEEYSFANLASLGEKLKCVEDCFEVRKSEVIQYLQMEMLGKLENPVVTGYDWKVKWIIGSSALSSIREPVAQMDLKTLRIKNNEHIRDSTMFEMNLTELDNFISQLESSLASLKDV